MTRYPIPVARIIIPDVSGRVLILQRGPRGVAPGRWSLPGGKVDYGDTVDETVRKELREETALECSGARFLFYQDSLPVAPGEMHGINLYFECAVSGTVHLNAESAAFTWIGPADLEDYTLAFRNDLALRRYWGLDPGSGN